MTLEPEIETHAVMGGGTEQMCMSSVLYLNFDLIFGTKKTDLGALLDFLVPLPSVAIHKFLFFCFLLLALF